MSIVDSVDRVDGQLMIGKSSIYLFVLDSARDGGLTGEIESHNWSHFVLMRFV